MRLAASVVAGALIVVFATFALFVVSGKAADPCAGQLVRASWYGAESGRKTASGGYFDGRQWLVAHKSLPLGTKLKLSYGGRSVVVPVLDRGPYIAGRTLDLSRAVAVALGTIHAKEGAPLVCMERL